MSDYQVGDTVYKKFTSRAFATGVPTTLAGTPVVSIYEDDSLTQITAGVTLTADFDSVVGLNNLTIVATGGNGFETGKYYSAIITTGTVGGVSVVGEEVLTFTLEASAAALELANGTDGLTAIKADTAAILIDTNDLQTNQGDWLTATGFNTVIPPSVAQFDARTILSANYFDPAVDAVANVTLVATTTTNTDMRGTDSANTVAPDNASIASILVDTNDLQTNQGDWLTATGFSVFNAATDEVNANTVKVNGATVLGAGTAANLWRGN